MCNTRPAIPAPGAAEKLVGTNPLAIALPTAREPHIVFDMATSAGSIGKVRQALSAGTEIPAGWAVDANGLPTTDPAEALEGFLLPAAGPKGFGLSLVIDLLCGGLSGGGWGPHLGEMRGDLGKPYNGSSLFLAIDVGHFQPPAAFAETMQEGAERIRRARKAPGTDRLYTPGERAFEARRSAGGAVRVEAKVLEGLNRMAERLRVSPLTN
jgi:LDH2 family malate/lactate/ureidoglycolate dehydrogenase